MQFWSPQEGHDIMEVRNDKKWIMEENAKNPLNKKVDFSDYVYRIMESDIILFLTKLEE